MDKNLLIIGGSSDIGMAVIKDQIDLYDKIIVHYNNMNQELEDLCKNNKIISIQADLNDELSTKQLIDTIDSLDITPTHMLHLPAAKYELRKFQKTSWNDVEYELNISLRSAVMILGYVLPKMSKCKFGKVVIMLSEVINGSPPKYTAKYVIVKEALYGMVKSLAVEYAEKGISINGISPTLMRTKFVDNMHEYMIESMLEENAKKSPSGKNLEVEDILPTIKFLLTEGSNSITGQNILVTFGG